MIRPGSQLVFQFIPKDDEINQESHFFMDLDKTSFHAVALGLYLEYRCLTQITVKNPYQECPFTFGYIVYID